MTDVTTMEMGTPVQPSTVVSDITNGVVMPTVHTHTSRMVDDIPSSPPLDSTGSEGSHEEQSDCLQSPNMIPMMVDSVFSVPGSPLVVPVMVQSEGIPSNSHTPQTSPPPLGTDLLTVLRQQLEYYFSKDNLSTDKYLLSQMDGDHFVPISILSSFNQVKKLTSDVDLIIKAIRDSSVLQTDPTTTKVRAIPEKRCILILREIPKETPKEEIHRLFSGVNCPKFMSCEFAENDCWYVTFSGEEDAQEAFRYLREEVREFLGNPIRARIKNTAVQRTSSLPKPRPQQYPYPMAMYNGQPVPYYQQSVGWPYYDPRYVSALYINGYSPQSSYSGSNSGRSYSTSSNDRTESRGIGTREGVRRGSTGGGSGNTGTGGKGQRHLSDGASDKRPSNSSGHYSGSTGGGGGGRYRRDNEERQRNLPNRLKNKRNEEMGLTTDKNEREGEKRERGNERTGGDRSRQRPQNKTTQKLDFAPTNFPPLPTTTDPVTPPPSSQPPVLQEEGNPNMADIVKGKKQKEGGNGGGNVSTDKQTNPPLPLNPPKTIPSIPPPPPPPPVKSVSPQHVPSTTSSTPTAAMVTAATVTAVGVAPPPNQSSLPKSQKVDSKVSTSKDRSVNRGGSGFRQGDKDKHNARNSQTSKGGNTGQNNRPRHRDKDYKDTRKPPPNGNMGGGSRQSRQSPKATKRSFPPPPPTNKESGGVDKDIIKQTDTSKPEKLSYAQMAQMAQQKPKSSPQKLTHTLSKSPPGGGSNDVSSPPPPPPPLPPSPPSVPPPSPPPLSPSIQQDSS